GRFRARFGDRLALLHSALGQGERHDEWHRIMRGEADLVVGARSAVFAPLPDIGVIVIDEENERAYKQDSPPRYHAVEVARRKAAQHEAVLVLGGATPSIETYHAAMTEEDFGLCELPERIDSRPLPVVEIVDLRGETLMGMGGTFSQRMLDALGECLKRGEQAMLFLNRRGFSTFVMCRACGEALRCNDCAVSLIYHHATRDMRCHHCDFSLPVPDVCPVCGSEDIGFHGLGTERVADQLQREFPDARVLRMDRDTTSHKGAYGDILRRFARGEANVLIGTQMIAKGHDFPDVTLVGVLNADVGLHRPDFRATEHTFQILTQVAGRAGRADKPGTVLVQTYNPEHPAIVYASRHDYGGFYRYELEKRRENLYPPFTRLVSLTIAHEGEEQALALGRKLAVNLQQLGLMHKRGERQFVGPAPAPLSKLRGRYRYHLLVKGPRVEELGQVVLRAVAELGDEAGAVTIDVDPMDMM
ncbi:MAG TPA: primosomal protein N', partial [Armatimonadota bacterium]|nr:primosomal protein N' [Armatimonadota bacterium]